MDIKRALKGQYRAGLKMLRQCIADASEDLWASGGHPRTYWRIAYHAVFYTHLYLMPTKEDFQPWDKHRDGATDLWEDPPVIEPYSQVELLEYLDWLDANVSDFVDRLDLESPESGFEWYPNIEKLDHQILNIRHLAGHMGQLSELAMRGGIEEIDWSTRVPRNPD